MTKKRENREGERDKGREGIREKETGRDKVCKKDRGQMASKKKTGLKKERQR